MNKVGCVLLAHLSNKNCFVRLKHSPSALVFFMFTGVCFLRRMSAKVPSPSKMVRSFPTRDVWAIFTPLANEFKASNIRASILVNLGQGFPDFPAADFVKESAKKAIDANMNQYAPSRGLLELRQVFLILPFFIASCKIGYQKFGS